MENKHLGIQDVAEKALNRIRDPDRTEEWAGTKRLDLKPLGSELHRKVTALMSESPSDAWHWLKVLTLVGKFKSANKAGQLLRRDAGGVTRLLQTFQTRLGVKLFDDAVPKSNVPVGERLTPAGRELYEWARPRVEARELNAATADLPSDFRMARVNKNTGPKLDRKE